MTLLVREELNYILKGEQYNRNESNLDTIYSYGTPFGTWDYRDKIGYSASALLPATNQKEQLPHRKKRT